MMRKFRILSALALCLAGQQAMGQDARTLDTRIADLLVQMPVSDLQYRDKLAEETFGLGPEGLSKICSLVVPPGAGDDTQARFAIESLSKCLSGEVPTARSETWEKICIQYATGGGDRHVQAFFMSQLQWIGSGATVDALAPYLSDDFLCSPAIAAIQIADPLKAGEVLTGALASLSGKPQIEAVKALGELKASAAAPLLEDLSGMQNEADLQRTVLRALAAIGDPDSYQTLLSAAKSAKFLPEQTGATSALLEYAAELGRQGHTAMSSDLCRMLMKKCKAESQLHFKSQALTLYAGNEGINMATPELVRALKDGNKSYRMGAIQYAIDHAGPAGPWISELEKTKDPEVRSEIIYLLAGLQDPAALPALQTYLDDPYGEVRSQAVGALAALQGPAAAGKIVTHMLKYPAEPDLTAGKSALMTSAGAEDIKPYAAVIPDAPDPVKAVLLEILAEKGDPAFFEVLLDHSRNENRDVSLAAVSGLKNTAAGKDLDDLLGLLAEDQDPAWTAAVQQAVIASVNDAEDTGRQISKVLSSMESSGKKMDYIPILSGIGGETCLQSVEQLYDNSQGDTRELALQALAAWKDGTAIPVLFSIYEDTGAVPAFKGYVEQVARSGHIPDQQLLLLRKIMPLARDADQQNSLISACGDIKTFLSLVFVAGYMDDENLRQAAADAAVRIVLPTPGREDGLAGDQVREILSSAKEMVSGPDAPYIKIDIETYLKSMPDDEGYVSLFNGKDLSGWQGLVENPLARAQMSESELAAKQAEANELMLQHWLVENGHLVFRGPAFDNICTVRDYRDFELIMDWKINKNGDSGVYLRGTPQVQIWDPFREEEAAQVGSGGLFNNQEHESKPLQLADNSVGEWNTFRITMIGERVSVYLNGILVVDNVILENYWDRSLPIFPSGPIELQAHASVVAFRDIFVREIRGAELSPEEKAAGFVLLFNGKDLDGWIGNKVNHVVEDGTIAIRPELGGRGNLYTEKEYSNFNLRLEFKLTPGANNGLGIRTPPEGDAAYVGMEFQVLDNTAEVYANLKPWQYHGSVYGVIPAKRGYLKPVGEWNQQEVIVDGTRIRIILNGTTIVDGDIADSMRNGTLDGRDHPGLQRKSGHIGFLGHGSVLWYRNIRIKELNP
jgi:HEAT repeat protein